MFSIILIDEVHGGAAPQTAKILSRFTARYRLGLTGSPDRKDCLAAGTQVSTPTGLRFVETLKVGDVVYSFNHRTGTVEEKMIEDHWSVDKEAIVELTMASGRKLLCSTCERIFVDGEYREASSLVPGDTVTLLTSS